MSFGIFKTYSKMLENFSKILIIIALATITTASWYSFYQPKTPRCVHIK